MDDSDIEYIYDENEAKLKKKKIENLGSEYKLKIGTKVEKIVKFGPFPNNNEYGHIIGNDETTSVKSYVVQFDTGKKDIVHHSNTLLCNENIFSCQSPLLNICHIFFSLVL
eukprot:gene3874-7088_t